MDNIIHILREELAYRTFRVWCDFWSNQDTYALKIPGVIHHESISRDEVILTGSCSKDELLHFIESQDEDLGIHYGYETSDFPPEWMGHWCRFRVTRLSE